MKKLFKYICIIGLSLIVVFLALYVNNDLGILQSKIENDARKSQKIDESWEMAKDSTSSMAAMIFYDINGNVVESFEYKL